MTERSLQLGDIVTVRHRTGEYISEIIELTPSKALVKTLAVITHPTQGDLHNLYETNVPLFHQRKAMAFLEKVYVPTAVLRPYLGESVPTYLESLHQALHKIEEQLRERDDEYANLALHQLTQLRNEYFL
ncbi:sporulation phosphorelay system protein KapB [Brevibacillus laterosporus]|uniref:Kinase n=1 Tax=Brevibacillus laterosporus TaxID=1465 RepID=A0AAP8QGJ9_BRELA|nr:sporulation phosphorelay system protein KapB [Brevibacillus laterosporus]MBG9772076.1 kinase [Brevibacillus laterosporus]MED1666192.1 sporulation phosphorelay system protein KapB [Brevibacillus laterosporus]MED1670515.1 sporulation phosphorelay system protein KapB [Brevibacillus laterosporus]MED1716778.1 sporulation phosphorelay system protein KapB [Brevibacillus laterosporus]PPA81346.1 kinase [Brevibacillus laterosporus]